MNAIRILDNTTIDKVAAGEVVERPASVVKELVENAIDAGSSNIDIDVEDGGLKLIQVSDNGSGMSAADARLAVLRHATSKLRAIEDLFSLTSMGFRGEALPSIAAVSRLELETRSERDEYATIIRIAGGELLEEDNRGRSYGTTVVVRDLFYNIPARRKFLKNPSTENSHISNIVTKIALANTAVKFKYRHNGKLLLSTPGNSNLVDTIVTLYGKDLAADLLPVEFANDVISVRGYVARPNHTRSSRAWQTFCVNERIINNKIVFKALDNAYHSLLPRHGFCFAVLLLRVEPNAIDVNVHPQKTEIKFSHEQEVYSGIYKAVSLALADGHSTGTAVATAPTRSSADFAPSGYRPAIGAGYSQAPLVTVAEVREALSAPGEQMQLYTTSLVEKIYSMPVEDIRVLGVYDTLYVRAEVAGELLIIDQHAAHERIVYDRMTADCGRVSAQQLLITEFVDLSQQECDLALKHALDFYELGFTMEQSAPQQLRLTEIPADLNNQAAAQAFMATLKYLQHNHRASAAELRHEFLCIAACRAAVKAGDTLNNHELRKLVHELMSTKLPYACPHGRPTALKFSPADLAKMFKRS